MPFLKPEYEIAGESNPVVMKKKKQLEAQTNFEKPIELQSHRVATVMS